GERRACWFRGRRLEPRAGRHDQARIPRRPGRQSLARGSCRVIPMSMSQSIDVRLALALAAYHRRLGTRVPDGDLGFRCPDCGQSLVARESTPTSWAHFDHLDSASTCRSTQFGSLRRGFSSVTLARYFTPAVKAAVMRDYLARVSDEGDETSD